MVRLTTTSGTNNAAPNQPQHAYSQPPGGCYPQNPYFQYPGMHQNMQYNGYYAQGPVPGQYYGGGRGYQGGRGGGYAETYPNMYSGDNFFQAGNLAPSKTTGQRRKQVPQVPLVSLLSAGTSQTTRMPCRSSRQTSAHSRSLVVTRANTASGQVRSLAIQESVHSP
jgi:hypothetical protein